jgi:small conductance mechanosensitive channel
MRFSAMLLFLSLALAGPAAGQSLAIHQAAPGPAPGAKALAGAIIPGSPLADLTRAATPAPADPDTATPFGTTNIGFSLASGLVADAGHTAMDFIGAIHNATRLEPVGAWLASFQSIPTRRVHALHIMEGTLLTMLPALLVERAVGWLLSAPRRSLMRRAARLPQPLSEEDGIALAEAGETEQHPGRVSFRAWARRAGLALLYLLLRLLPVGGFVAVMWVLIVAGVLATPQALHAVIGLANAYLFYRLSLEAVRLVLAPDGPELRLIRLATHRAVWGLSWVSLLFGTGAAGYAVILVAEVLGLSHDGAGTVIRVLALVLHIEVAMAIWHCRRVVAGWIAGRQDADSKFNATRRGLGRVWHFLALFYVMALWIALAAGVHHAFGILLRVVMVFIISLILGRIAWDLSAALLERLFPAPDDKKLRHPKLYARVHAYNPALRVLARVVIAFLVLVLILQGWGVNAFGWLLTDPVSRALLAAAVSILVTVALALALWEFADVSLAGRIDRLSATGRTRQASRLSTLLPMLRAAIGVTIALFTVLICLSKIGVNLVPLLAVSGVAGIAIGFGSQKLVQDIITGLFLLLEDAMQVGDVVSLAGMSGVVERLSIRTIRLRGGDGSINIIPFSAVTTVTNMTRDFGYAEISIHVGYKENIDHVSAVLMDIARTMRAEPAWGSMMKDDLQLFGLDAFGANALVLTGQIRTGPGQHWSVRREFYGRVQKRFGQEGIEIPYTQQRFMIDPMEFRQAVDGKPPQIGQG